MQGSLTWRVSKVNFGLTARFFLAGRPRGATSALQVKRVLFYGIQPAEALVNIIACANV